MVDGFENFPSFFFCPPHIMPRRQWSSVESRNLADKNGSGSRSFPPTENHVLEQNQVTLSAKVLHRFNGSSRKKLRKISSRFIPVSSNTQRINFTKFSLVKPRLGRSFLLEGREALKVAGTKSGSTPSGQQIAWQKFNRNLIPEPRRQPAPNHNAKPSRW